MIFHLEDTTQTGFELSRVTVYRTWPEGEWKLLQGLSYWGLESWYSKCTVWRKSRGNRFGSSYQGFNVLESTVYYNTLYYKLSGHDLYNFRSKLRSLCPLVFGNNMLSRHNKRQYHNVLQDPRKNARESIVVTSKCFYWQAIDFYCLLILWSYLSDVKYLYIFYHLYDPQTKEFILYPTFLKITVSGKNPVILY